MKISASIVIYNEDEKTLEKVIKSFLELKYKKELIIIDNSPQNILQYFCSKFKEVRYIYNNENIGFGSGHNLAYKYFNILSDIHLILNPDIHFQKEQIEGFLEWFNKTNDIALALPKVVNLDGSVQNIVRNIPTPLSLLQRKIKINFDEIEVEDNIVREIPFAHGCFLAFKSDCFEKIGGFDERFFLYMEDVDIFIRAKECGRTVINTNYFIYHEHRKGSSKNLKLLKYHIVSAIKFFIKYKIMFNNRFPLKQ